jgi:hypothetical protein
VRRINDLDVREKRRRNKIEKHLHIQVQPAVMYVKFVKKMMKKDPREAAA